MLLNAGSYLSTVTKLNGLMRDLRGELTRGGLRVPTSGGSLDSLKFLLKQQQKALQDNTNPSKTGIQDKFTHQPSTPLSYCTLYIQCIYAWVILKLW